MNNEKPSFLDRSTLLAMFLILIFWFGWAKFMESRYPQQPAVPAETTTAPAETQSNQVAGASGAPAPVSDAPPTTPDVSATAETTIDFSTDSWSFQITSKGMGLKNIVIKDFTTRDGKPVVLGDVPANHPFATNLLSTGEPVDFQVEQTGPNTFVGRSAIGSAQIVKTVNVDPKTYTIDVSTDVSGAAGGFRGLAVTVSDVLLEGSGGSFLAPSYDHQDWLVRHDGKRTREILYKEEGSELSERNVTLAGLSAHYFALAVIDRSQLMPRFETKVPPGASYAVGRLMYEPAPGGGDSFSVRYVGFAGPKSFETLRRVDESLTELIDFGIFAFIAKPILWLLRYLHSLIGNWGWAIIALTIIVRIIVLPFNVYSFRSMKVMQKLQPEMQRIREKYKDKGAEQRLQMNQEIMQLMKHSKANPMGGCLPMLLQLPVFFALYQVLGQSIELYHAPFGWWIQDLSAKDPFFVLPILMAVAMFVNQKMMPTTMDPQQAKIMLWMPVIFAVFMVSLPSGLTLYILVSTLFGIVQQYFLMRDSSVVRNVKEAKA